SPVLCNSDITARIRRNIRGGTGCAREKSRQVVMVGTESVASLLMDLDWWQYRSAERDDFFASLRRENPRAFVPVGARGFWALTRHADVLEVSRRPEDFCSGEGTQIFDQPVKLREYRGSFIDMD